MNRQRFEQRFGSYQDVDKSLIITSSHQTSLKAVDVIVLFVFKAFKITC